MRKGMVWFLAVLFTVLSVVSCAAWLNNVYIATNVHKTLLETKTLPENSDSRIGFITQLDWTAVDYSTVTTFVPLMGFVLIAIGFFRLTTVKKDERMPEHFPFYKSYNSFTCTLGLIGTVWGLIMIGFFNPKAIQISNLVICLHTALYSTLIALLWVYLVANPARKIMQGYYRKFSGEPEDLSLTEFLKSIATETAGITAQLGVTKNVLGALNQQLDPIVGELKRLKNDMGFDANKRVAETCGQLATVCVHLTQLIGATASNNASQQTVLTEIRTTLQANSVAAAQFRAATEAVLADNKDLKKKLETAEKTSADATRKLAQATKEREGAEKRAATLKQQFESIKKTLVSVERSLEGGAT